jgi:hypothetical protein
LALSPSVQDEKHYMFVFQNKFFKYVNNAICEAKIKLAWYVTFVKAFVIAIVLKKCDEIG